MTKEEIIYQRIAGDNQSLRWAAQGTASDSAQRMVGAMQSLLKHADTLCPGAGFATSVDLVDVGLIGGADEMWSKWRGAAKRADDLENELKRANESMGKLEKKYAAWDMWLRGIGVGDLIDVRSADGETMTLECVRQGEVARQNIELASAYRRIEYLEQTSGIAHGT